VNSNATETNPVRSRLSFFLGLFNFCLGLYLALMPFGLLIFKDMLPDRSPLVFGGGGIVIALFIWPMAILFSLIGIVMMIVAHVKRNSVRAEGSPLTVKNKISLGFSALLLLFAVWNTFAIAGF
jgi:uncharacterized Tic20 family protein